MEPKITFDNRNIYRRLDSCLIVARAYGWPSEKISKFTEKIMEIICRNTLHGKRPEIGDSLMILKND